MRNGWDPAANYRTFDEQVREAVLSSIKRIITAEAEASGAPKPPTFTAQDRFPLSERPDAGSIAVRVATPA